MAETSGTGDYTLDTTILKVVGWLWSATGGVAGVPQRMSPQEIERLRAVSTSASGTPAYAYALAGANLLMVYPTPSAADTITIYYVPRPTEMSTGANDPSVSTYGGIPVEYHDAIEAYCLWRAGEFSADLQSAAWFRTIYEGQNGKGGLIGRIRRDVLLKAGPLPPASVRRNSRRFVFHDNSVYL